MKRFSLTLLTSLVLASCGPELERSSLSDSEGMTEEEVDIDPDFLLVNGVKTSAFPEVVLVYIRSNPAKTCTGTFVGSNAVLTAAHCLSAANASDYYIFTGTKFADTKKLSQAIKVTKVIGDFSLGKKALLLPGDSARDLAMLITEESPNKIAQISTAVVKQNSKLVGVGYGLHTEKDIDYIPRTGNFLSTDASDVPAQFRPSLINTLSGLKQTFNLQGDSGGPKFLNGKIVAVVSAAGRTGSQWLGRNTALSTPFAKTFLDNAKKAGAKIGVQGAAVPPKPEPTKPTPPTVTKPPVAPVAPKPTPAAPKPTPVTPKPEPLVVMPPKQPPVKVEPPKTASCTPNAAFINAARAEDVNGNGAVTALDALNIINAMSALKRQGKTFPHQLVDGDSKFKVDVSRDGCIDENDADLVIYFLSRKSRQ